MSQGGNYGSSSPKLGQVLRVRDSEKEGKEKEEGKGQGECPNGGLLTKVSDQHEMVKYISLIRCEEGYARDVASAKHADITTTECGTGRVGSLCCNNWKL